LVNRQGVPPGDLEDLSQEVLSTPTPARTPFQMALEVAIDTAAFLLQGNTPALFQLNFFSVTFLGRSLPPASRLHSTILSDLSESASAAMLGIHVGIQIADSVNATTK
jgi:hypothetical protein